MNGHQIDVNDVTIWTERKTGLNMVRKNLYWSEKDPSLDCKGGTRITLSHSWDRSINTMQFFSISDNFRKYEHNRKTTPTDAVTTTVTLKTSNSSRNVGLPYVFLPLLRIKPLNAFHFSPR